MSKDTKATKHDEPAAQVEHAPKEPHAHPMPSEGGSYHRAADGSLKIHQRPTKPPELGDDAKK